MFAELGNEVLAGKASLNKLRQVLGDIREIIREQGKGVKLSLVCGKEGEKAVYERNGKERCLPDDISKFE